MMKKHLKADFQLSRWQQLPPSASLMVTLLFEPPGLGSYSIPWEGLPHPFLKEELALASESPGLGRPRPSLEDQTNLASVRLLKEIGSDGRQPQRNGPVWEYPPENLKTTAIPHL